MRNGVSERDVKHYGKQEYATDLIFINFQKGYKGVSQKDFYTVKTTDNDFQTEEQCLTHERLRKLDHFTTQLVRVREKLMVLGEKHINILSFRDKTSGIREDRGYYSM